MTELFEIIKHFPPNSPQWLVTLLDKKRGEGKTICSSSLPYEDDEPKLKKPILDKSFSTTKKAIIVLNSFIKSYAQMEK